jgi:hypothetical protein
MRSDNPIDTPTANCSVPLIPTAASPSNDHPHTHTHNNKLSRRPFPPNPRQRPKAPTNPSPPHCNHLLPSPRTTVRANGEFGDDDESLATTTETGGCAGSRQHRTHTRPHTFPFWPGLSGTLAAAVFAGWVLMGR